MVKLRYRDRLGHDNREAVLLTLLKFARKQRALHCANNIVTICLYCFVYVDDILVFSPDLSSHVIHLREVLELCRLHGLTVGLPKCVFAVSEIEFLGHNLTSSGCQPLSKLSRNFLLQQINLLFRDFLVW